MISKTIRGYNFDIDFIMEQILWWAKEFGIESCSNAFRTYKDYVIKLNALDNPFSSDESQTPLHNALFQKKIGTYTFSNDEAPPKGEPGVYFCIEFCGDYGPKSPPKSSLKTHPVKIYYVKPQLHPGSDEPNLETYWNF